VQLSAIRYLLEVGGGLEPGVHELPAAADDAVAALALRTSGLAIDSPAAARDDIPLVDWHTTRFGEEGDR
jgi:S-adenosylhomocysteine hydrolase